MALGSSTGPDDTMVLSDSTGHSDLYDPSSGTVLGHYHDPRWQPIPQASTWLGGSRSHGYQDRPWLQQGHHPRHGPSGSLAHMVSWLQLAVHVPQIWVAPEAAWPLGTNMVTGGGPDPGHPCGLWWQHGP